MVDKKINSSKSLPVLPAGRLSPVRQRGILSEVVKAHDADEVMACKGAPTSASTLRIARGNTTPIECRSKFKIPVDIEKVPLTRFPPAPKVIDVYDHDPGDRPRKLTVERRLREYAAKDIGALLEGFGVPTAAKLFSSYTSTIRITIFGHR